MNPTINGNKHLITTYLNALSGRPKTPEVVARFVSDQRLLEHIREVEAAFPAYELVVEETIAERDLVAVRGIFRGVHRGPFAGIAATGKSVSASLMITYRVEGGRIVDHWMQFDLFGLLEQLKSNTATSAA